MSNRNARQSVPEEGRRLLLNDGSGCKQSYVLKVCTEPDEADMAAIRRLTEAVNAADGSRYGAPEEADRYYLILREADESDIAAVLAAFSMGETRNSDPVTEWFAMTSAPYRRQGCFHTLKDAALAEEEPSTQIRFGAYENAVNLAFFESIEAEHGSDELMMRKQLTGPEEGTPELKLEMDSEEGRAVSRFGECGFQMYGSSVYIYGVLTYRRFRRKGYGKAMLRELLYRLRTGQQAESAFLQVSGDNEAAIALYRSLGFEETERLSFYYKKF